MRIGMGYDVHKLVEGRKLILGGVEIPYEKMTARTFGCRMCCSMRSWMRFWGGCTGDIGKHFPDTDPAYKGFQHQAVGACCRSLRRTSVSD